MTQNIGQYIEAQRRQGKTDDEIRVALKGAGWDDAHIDPVLQRAVVPDITVPGIAPVTASGQLPGFGTLIAETWQIVQSKIGVLLAISLCTVTLSPLLSLVNQLTAAEGQVPSMGYAGSIGLVGWALDIIGSASFIIVAVRRTENLAFGQILRQALSLFIPYLATVALSGLLVFIGFVALVIPGIFLAVSVLFAPIITVVEGVRGGEAIRRSMRLIRPRWFAVFSRVFLLGIIITIPVIGATITSLLSGTILQIANAMSVVSSLVIAPFFGVFLVRMYEHVRGNAVLVS